MTESAFWDCLSNSDLLDANQHFDLVSKLKSGGISQDDFSFRFLRSYSFQEGNLSELEVFTLSSLADLSYGYLFDPGFEGEIWARYRRNASAADANIERASAFLATSASLFPRRFAVIGDDVVETKASCLMPDGTKGVHIYSGDSGAALRLGLKELAHGFAGTAPVSGLGEWLEEGFVGFAPGVKVASLAASEGRMRIFGENADGYLVHHHPGPYAFVERERMGELVGYKDGKDPKAFEPIWTRFGPWNITRLSAYGSEGRTGPGR